MSNTRMDTLVAPPLAIEMQKLNASIGKKHILRDISFQLASGRLLSILGPNGAGKTTLIKVLIGGIAPTSGTASVVGFDVTRHLLHIKRRIGITPQENNLYEDLSAAENLQLHGRLFGMSGKQIRARTDEVLDLVDLRKRKKDTVKHFSGGMKRRLVIARSIFHYPDIVFLDEPTTGLDPDARRSIWQMIQGLKQQHVSLLLTTHYMEEAEQLSDDVIVMNSGMIIAEGTTSSLLSEHVGGAFVELTGVSEEHQQEIQRLFPQVQVFENEAVRIPTSDLADIPGVIQTLAQKDLPYASILTRKATLEDVFFKLTGRKIAP